MAATVKRVQQIRTPLRLESCDKVQFLVERDVACMSSIVKEVVKRGRIVTPIPIRLVDSKTLEKVVEYCTYHVQADREGMPNAQINAWDAQFLTVDIHSLNRLFWAADVMKIPELRDLTSEVLRQHFKEMPDEDIPDPEGRILLDKFYS